MSVSVLCCVEWNRLASGHTSLPSGTIFCLERRNGSTPDGTQRNMGWQTCTVAADSCPGHQHVSFRAEAHPSPWGWLWVFVVSGCSAPCIPDPRGIEEEGRTTIGRVMQGTKRWSVGSGHSRWLFSCSWYLLCPTRALLTGLTFLLTCPKPQLMIVLIEGVVRGVPLLVSLVTKPT